MRYLQYLQEDYVTMGKALLATHGKDIPFDIFVNPSVKEMRSIGNPELRYAINFKSNNLYVWSADYIHLEGFTALKQIPDMRQIMSATPQDSWKYISTGVAKLTGGKLKFIESDAGIIDDARWMQLDDKWLSKWFTDPYIKTFMKSKGIKEEWDSTIKQHSIFKDYDLYDIYHNPTATDYKELRKAHGRNNIRFAIDLNSKNVYVWSDYVLHQYVINHLKLDKKNILVGMGYVGSSNKIKADTFGSYMGNKISFQSKEIRTFLDKYFKNLDDWDI